MREPTPSERRLANIAVEMVLTATADPVFCAKSVNERGAWVARTLQDHGFHNAPVGANHAYLTGVTDDQT